MARAKLDFDVIAKGLGAQRRGRVKSQGGYYGAMELAAELAQRLRVPETGGRATDPAWTLRRAVPLSRPTLERLNADAALLHIEPMQLAALLIEKGLQSLEPPQA